MTLKNLMDLIQKYIHDELDSKGMEELRLALEQTEHQEILGQILENQLKNRAFETEEELSAVFERLETKLDNYIHQKGNMPELQVSFKRKLYNRLMAAAAVLVFIFSVTAAYLLMHKGSRKNIEIAKKLLDIFSKSFIALYGAFHATLTFHHITTHLVDDVISHGSSIGHSLYSLEGSLGYVTKSLSGTRGYSSQFIKSIYFLLRNIKLCDIAFLYF